MGIEDRLREDLRRSARTATGADVLPEALWQKIQHRIAHQKRGVVVQVETVAVALPPPWSRSCGSSSRSLALATSISRNRPCSSSGQGRPSTVEC